MKRITTFAMAALLGLTFCYSGLGWRATQQLAFAQEISDLFPGAFQVSYFDVSSSFTKSQQGYGGPGHSGGNGDALVRIVNAGNFTDAPSGDVCATIYVFDDDQEMQECCACPLTADSVQTFSTINDLTSNPQFSSPLGVGVIKILGRSTVGDPFSCTSGGNGQLGTPGSGVANGAVGLHAWIGHTESIASNNPNFKPAFGFVTSTSVEHFEHAPIDEGEVASPTAGLIPTCANIELHSSGRGICHCGIGS